MDALILAGGDNPPDLEEVVGTKERALGQINGRPMLSYVLEAVRGAEGIERIAVAGSDAVLDAARSVVPEVMAVAPGAKMMDNALAGIRALGESLVLITTCDVPLVTAATYDELLTDFHRRHLEAAYAIASRKVCEARFPGGKRTYAHLREGDYTAGNAVIVPGRIVGRLAEVFEQFYRARKQPLAMAKLLGPQFLWKFATRRLSVKDAESKMAGLVGCRAGAIEMNDPTIAFDVDKLEDYVIARQALAQSSGTIQNK